MFSRETEKTEPLLIAGGSDCGKLWAATGDRWLWVLTAGNRSAVAAVPVPSTSAIVALDLRSKTVMLADGSRYAWSADLSAGGRWSALPNILDARGLMTLRALSGFAGPHGDLQPGDEVELSEAEARPLLAVGRVELVAP